MAESLSDQLAAALKLRERALTPSQRLLRDETDARNKAIQEAPIKAMKFGCPKDKT